MSIISKITTAVVVFAFGLLALGAMSSTAAASPGSVSVSADEPWGKSASVTDDEPWGTPAPVADDEPWG
jgi:hypothetical protein